jgi:hypothetical protein
VSCVPDDAQRAEAQRVLDFFGDKVKALETVERQLGILVLRTQVLLSLSGIVITVTGFSGKQIAQSGRPGPELIVSGLATVLAAASVLVAGVLRLTWVTKEIGEDGLETVARGIALRDAKAWYLQVAMILFVVGFALYVGAIANLLLRT